MNTFGLVVSFISIICWSILFVDSYMVLQDTLLTAIAVVGLLFSGYVLVLSMRGDDE